MRVLLNWIYGNMKVREVELYDIYNYKEVIYQQYRDIIQSLPEDFVSEERRKAKDIQVQTSDHLSPRKTYNLRQREAKKNG